MPHGHTEGLASGLLPWPPRSAARWAPRPHRERFLFAQLRQVCRGRKVLQRRDDPLLSSHLPHNSSCLPAIHLRGGIFTMALPWGEDWTGYSPFSVVTKTTAFRPESPKAQRERERENIDVWHDCWLGEHDKSSARLCRILLERPRGTQ